MAFYDLSSDERQKVVSAIEKEIENDIRNGIEKHLLKYFSDEDTYIRKTAYITVGKLYFAFQELHQKTLAAMDTLFNNPDEKVRQTIVNALGEIGKKEAKVVLPFFEKAIVDQHHSVRNAVIGSLKKMGEKNPEPVLSFSKKFLHHNDPEVRRQAVHGVELRGRTHPEDVLPLLHELQNEKVKRVRNVVIHVIGQISYKTGCLEKVVTGLNKWDNTDIITSAVSEILETHKAYEKFSEKSYKEAGDYIKSNLKTI